MKRTVSAIVVLAMCLCLSGCQAENNPRPNTQVDAAPEGVLSPGDTITVADVIFTYDGYYKEKYGLTESEHFVVENNGDTDIAIAPLVVGVKKDGSYELLGTAVFGGVDWDSYNQDMEENGWAIHNPTNRVKSGGRLEASSTIMDFGGDYSMDVDNDGYYDIVFQTIFLNSEGGFMITGDEPKSDVYKLKVR